MTSKDNHNRPATMERHAQNRSLERGIHILRAFRPGIDLLGNSELADRTGLAPATISRLTQTLVAAGMLEHDRQRRAYRLAAPVLSLAHAMRSASPVLKAAGPLMRSVAEKLKVNVGLAIADGDEMIYLESVRYNRKVSLRNVVAGQRVPIELTSLGRAYLAVMPDDDRRVLLKRIEARRGQGWKALEQEIDEAIDNVRRQGYCAAAWQPEIIALAAPIIVEGRPIYSLNVSASTRPSLLPHASVLSDALLDLTERLHKSIKAS